TGKARADSDVDLLVEFELGREPGLLGLADMEAELAALLGARKVDLRTPRDLSAGISAMRSYGRLRSSMRSEDRVRLLHMIEAGEAIAQFLAGRSAADLQRDQLLLFAVVRGRAASEACGAYVAWWSGGQVSARARPEQGSGATPITTPILPNMVPSLDGWTN